jgi:hypothetical protein
MVTYSQLGKSSLPDVDVAFLDNGGEELDSLASPLYHWRDITLQTSE